MQKLGEVETALFVGIGRNLNQKADRLEVTAVMVEA